ncbi:hypothetical protein C882_1134 [Caenispirillum salinarum AK4]|uniref:Lipoprotein n=1 Tax=Caenispirillum salinarum AK4 TaxID=1238182 RepID=K9HCA1_9PROT|nr:hypothetical protein [Caenispirillum salinarum]EKV28133.1 hypothetical protein C882_1134 [Caenispirillum salinarum AK4]
MRRIWIVLAAAATALGLSACQTTSEKQTFPVAMVEREGGRLLSAQDLEAAFSPGSRYLFAPQFGSGHFAELRNDGTATVTYRTGGSTKGETHVGTGRVEIEGNQLCYHFADLARTCGEVYAYQRPEIPDFTHYMLVTGGAVDKNIYPVDAEPLNVAAFVGEKWMGDYISPAYGHTGVRFDAVDETSADVAQHYRKRWFREFASIRMNNVIHSRYGNDTTHTYIIKPDHAYFVRRSKRSGPHGAWAVLERP